MAKFKQKKLTYPYEYFNNIDEYKKTVNNLRKEDFVSKLKDDYPDFSEIARTNEIIKVFDFKNGDELTKLYLKKM